MAACATQTGRLTRSRPEIFKRRVPSTAARDTSLCLGSNSLGCWILIYAGRNSCPRRLPSNMRSSGFPVRGHTRWINVAVSERKCSTLGMPVLVVGQSMVCCSMLRSAHRRLRSSDLRAPVSSRSSMKTANRRSGIALARLRRADSLAAGTSMRLSSSG